MLFFFFVFTCYNPAFILFIYIFVENQVIKPHTDTLHIIKWQQFISGNTNQD